jgi:hypothetical protein
MRVSICWWERTVAVGLAFLLAVPLSLAATDKLPQAPQPNLPAASGQNQTQSPAQNPTQNQQPSAPTAQRSAPQQPMGTAAAPYVQPEGVTASRPAGAVIAPAKQRRVRIIAIRIALLVGAAVAIGTVAAASKGSPARP